MTPRTVTPARLKGAKRTRAVKERQILWSHHDGSAIDDDRRDQRCLWLSRPRREVDQQDVQITPLHHLHQVADQFPDERGVVDHGRLLVTHK